MLLTTLALTLSVAAEPASSPWGESGKGEGSESEFGESGGSSKKKDRSDTAFDSSAYLFLSPAFIHAPVGGEDDVEYDDVFDPGYQWGLGGGFFARSAGAFGFGVGAYFEHSIINFDDDFGLKWNQLRAGLELRPGFVAAERVFIFVPIRGGYAASILKFEDEFEDDTETDHGAHFGIGIGADVAVWRGLYVGAVIGGDLQFFRTGEDFDFHNVAFRGVVGYLF